MDKEIIKTQEGVKGKKRHQMTVNVDPPVYDRFFDRAEKYMKLKHHTKMSGNSFTVELLNILDEKYPGLAK